MSELRLYVVARTDMESMTPGRVAAQVSHATSKMMDDIQTYENDELNKLLQTWLNEADGFGTTIVLKPKTEYNQEKELLDLFEEINNENEINNFYYGGLVIDPEYFIKDGKTCHIVKDVLTCFFVFGYKEDVEFLIGDYDLF